MNTPNSSPNAKGNKLGLVFLAVSVVAIGLLINFAANRAPSSLDIRYAMETLEQADAVHQGVTQAIHDNNIQVLRSGDTLPVDLQHLVAIGYFGPELVKRGIEVTVQRMGERALVEINLFSDAALPDDVCRDFQAKHAPEGTLTCSNERLRSARLVNVKKPSNE